MIYRASWEDGRQVILRAADEEQARQRAFAFRQNDSLQDPHVPNAPSAIEMIPSRGATGVLLAGWENP